MSYVATLNRKSIAYPRAQKLSQGRDRKAIIFFLILLITLFGVLYIVQANSVATTGYEMQEYKAGLRGLESEHKNLELKVSEVQSLNFLEERIEELSMVETNKIDYLSPVSEVAAR